ncbi:hypothetical protein, partial [Escherichia coli]|uniref:hypothetical protein n=1 Tax=Escherichia coli TaxID=562 RepID=UPI001A7EBC63
ARARRADMRRLTRLDRKIFRQLIRADCYPMTRGIATNICSALCYLTYNAWRKVVPICLGHKSYASLFFSSMWGE